MTSCDNPFGLHDATWRGLGIATVLTCGFVIVYASLTLPEFVPLSASGGARYNLVDFEIFHLVGRMVWDGNLAQAYDFQSLHAEQVARTGSTDFGTWSYPPQFAVVVAVLGLIPRAISYFLFVGLTFAGFLLVLQKLAGNYSAAALVAISPALVTVARNGQNGFLTGGLIGLFCLLALRRQATAGIPLGLMIIKPHLAAGIGIYTLLSRSWRTMAVGVLVVALSFAGATLAFGADIWGVFLGGVVQTGGFLKQGLFPAFYMTSVYAALTTFGMSPDAAMIAQIVVAVCAVLVIIATTWARAPRKTQLGVAVLVSVIISPYGYGYDLPMLGIALAMLFPLIDRRGLGVEIILVFVLAWTATGWGVVRGTMRLAESDTHTIVGPDPVPSLAGIATLLLVVVILNIVRRDIASEKAVAVTRGQVSCRVAARPASSR